MKVYVVEVGQYSSRTVAAVTETKQEAKRLCDALGDDAGYEEFDTEQFQFSKLRYIVENYYGEWEAEIDKWGLGEKFKNNFREFEGRYIIYSDTPDNAIKIAQDMEAEYQAQKEGII